MAPTLLPTMLVDSVKTLTKQTKSREPIGRPVAEDSDDDPDFRRGPVPVETKQPSKARRSGKRRNESEVVKSTSQRPKKKRRVTRLAEPACNPLIELLGVAGDTYFQEWDKSGNDEVAEAVEDDTIEMEEAMDAEESLVSGNKESVLPPELDSGVLSDATTEDDDDGTGPADLSHLADRAEFLALMSRNSIQEPSKSELRRRQKYIDDPDATESDSDSPPEISEGPKTFSSNVVGDIVETFEPKPRFISRDPPPDIGPYVLDATDGIQIPSSINRYLRPYQREGVEFMWERYSKGRGGILGDDMGLGKTVQVISFLSAIMKKYADRRDVGRRARHTQSLLDRGYKVPRSSIDTYELPLPKPNETWPTCLLVAPAVLLSNWMNELETWGYFEFETCRSGALEDPLRQFRYGRLDIALVSIDTLARNMDKFSDQDWSVIILDEAHKIKNPTSISAIELSRLKCIRRFALTGTAVQNSYEELWTLLNWTNPGKVGSIKQWKWSISMPLKKGQSSTAPIEQLERAKKVAESLVHRLLPQFFLRRTKELLRGKMPNKNDQIVFCPLTEKQKKVYRNFLATPEVQRLLRRDEPCDCGSHEKRKNCCHRVGEGDLLRFIGIFLKVSNSLCLIYPVKSESDDVYAMHLQLQAVAFPEMTSVERFAPMSSSPEEESGKWRVLRGLLEDWRDENDEIERLAIPENASLATKLNKVLIFTKSRKLLDYIACTLSYEGFEFRELHGGIPSTDRDTNVEEFQNNPRVFVFLITTQTGGVGLNLTAANKVIIFDPNWNPAHDLQAMDRAFRIGQLRDVEVYRLVAAGCLEELIYKRQLYKQQQMMIAYEARTQTRYFEGIQGDKDMPGELFGIKNIFSLSETNDVQQRVEKAKFEESLWREEVAENFKIEPSDKDDNTMLKFLTESPMDTQAKIRKKKEEIMKQKLIDHGAVYTHSNDELLRTSIAESAKLNPSRYRKRESDNGVKEGKPKAYQPPKRTYRERPQGTTTRKAVDVMELSD